MNNFFTISQNIIISTGGVLTILLVYLAFAGHLKNFYVFLKNSLSKNYKEQLNIANKIIEWYEYIDINLDNESFNVFYLNSLEKEIDFRFSTNKKRKYLLKFKSKFQKKVLNYYSIDQKYHNEELFKKYARLNYDYIDIIFQLSNKIHKSSFTVAKFLLSDYWNILRGNFYKFYGQYKSEWKDIKSNERRYIMTDFENPVLILKLYYGIQK